MTAKFSNIMERLQSVTKRRRSPPIRFNQQRKDFWLLWCDSVIIEKLQDLFGTLWRRTIFTNDNEINSEKCFLYWNAWRWAVHEDEWKDKSKNKVSARFISSKPTRRFLLEQQSKYLTSPVISECIWRICLIEAHCYCNLLGATACPHPFTTNK